MSNQTHTSKNIPKYQVSIVAVIVLLLAWTLSTNLGLVSETHLPSPQAMWASILTLLTKGYSNSPLYEHIGYSLFRALSGFILGVLFGIPAGLIGGYNRVVDAAISPIMAFIRPIPPIAFIPMAVLYFGLGETGKVVLIFFTAFNYAYVNAHAGASGISIAYVRAGQSLGLTPTQLFFKIVMPAALPQIFTGLKVAMALSWAVVVAAELVGAQKGVGFMISDAAQVFQIPVVFIGIGLIGVIGLILNSSISLLETRIVHWKGR